MKIYSICIELEMCGVQENFNVIAPDVTVAAETAVRKLQSEPLKKRTEYRHLRIAIFESNEGVILK